MDNTSPRDGTAGIRRHSDKSTSLLLGWPTVLDELSARARSRRPKLSSSAWRHDLRRAIQYTGDGHLVTFAPTGAGKGVSVIIPNLLHYSGSTIVVDPKGENFAVTASYRRSLGQTVYLLDPFKAIDDEILARNEVSRGGLNPLYLARLAHTNAENDAQMIAQALSNEGVRGDPFWTISATKLLSGIICMEMEDSSRQNRLPSFQNLIGSLYADDPIWELDRRLSSQENSEFVRRSISGGFLSLDAKNTQDGILAVAQSYLSLLISSDLLPFVDKSTISLQTVQQSSNFTVYIVIPPNKLDSHSALLKVWIATLLYTVMERASIPDIPTLFILDECANLGELELLRKAVTLLRGYGMKAWMFFQDLSQLETLYAGSSKTMINNCGVLQTFGTSRRSAAQPLVSIMGQYSVNELQALDKNNQVLSISPGKPSISRLMRYYSDAAFAGRFDKNPLIRAPEKNKPGGVSRLINPDFTG